MNETGGDTLTNAGKKAGKRLKSARVLSGLTRKSFSEKSAISLPTLRAWEDPPPGRNGLTLKGAERLIVFFTEIGIYCTKEWLITGKGPAANFLNSFSSDLTKMDVTWGEEESILKDIESFKENNPSAFVVIIPDNSMVPKFGLNHYVGGHIVDGSDIKKLIGLNCIIELEDRIIVRKIMQCIVNRYTLISLNHDNKVNTLITDVEIKSAAEIIWHRWRKES